MNFGERLLGQDEKQCQMNNTWVPITSEKLILIRSNPISDWAINQRGRANFQEFHAPGSDYMKEMLLHYNGLDQNFHLIGQTGQTAEHNSVVGNSADRNRVLNHIAGSYTQAQHYESNGLNSTLELLIKKNATNIAAANRNLDASIDMAARNPLLPKLHPFASSDMSESYAGVQRCNIHSASDILYKDANRLLIPNRNPEFYGTNSDSLINSDIHCSVSNQLEGIFRDIPHGDPYPKYNLNYVPITEADATASFTNSFQSIPTAMDQLKFMDNQYCAIRDYTIAESTTQEKDQLEHLVSSTHNEFQEYCDGLLETIVDSSFGAISTSHGDQMGSEGNIYSEELDLGFDLNKTPEQKAPKRRKHRPKVIVEGRPKRSPKSATQKRQVKENPPKKRKSGPKTAATPQADIMKESFDSTVPTRKSCRKALNFDLENSRIESQNRIVCQQETYNRNDHEEALNTTSDYKAMETLSGANMKHGANSALLISQQDKLTIALSATTEEQIPNFPVTEKGPAQGNSDLCQQRNNGCMQQYIHAKEIANILFQSETCSENSQKTRELICQTTLQSKLNILSNSPKGKRFKRKYNSAANQHDSSTNPVGTSMCQEILQADENIKGAALAKGFLETPKRKKTKNRLHGKVSGRSSCQIMSKDDSQEVRIKDKKGSQSESNKEMPNCRIESNRSIEQQKNGAATSECFAISGETNQIYTLIDEIICRLNSLNLRESNISKIEEQKALVPYKGDGSVVPYQEFEFAKKHKPRPKVDLDPETERIWKLLMGKEGGDSLDGNDKEKEKWWEEERNVFRGRADSFIARMHLVQGDRRFSKWKGSVVDSVIGVFLTQNVSDHLSSSAFMSLAARFPHKPKGSKTYDVSTNTMVEEPEVCIVNPDDTVISYGRGILGQLAYDLTLETPHHTRELCRDSEIPTTKGSPVKPNNKSSEDEFLSLQDSLNSSITQGTRGIRSCLGSSSESEGPNRGCEAHFLTSKNSFQVRKTTVFQEFYNSVNGESAFAGRTADRQVQQAEYAKQSSMVDRYNNHNVHPAFSHPSNFGYTQKQVPIVPSTYYEFYSDTQGLMTRQMNGEESFWPETVSINSKFQDNYEIFGIPEVGDRADKPTEQHGNGTVRCPELPTMNPYEPISKHLVFLRETSQSRPQTNYNQQSPNHHLVGYKTLQPEGRPYMESLDTRHILGGGQDDVVNDCHNIPPRTEGFDSEKTTSVANRQVCSANSRVEPKPQNQVSSPGPTYKESKLKVSKARKVKTGAEKKHACDWDKLRKEVQGDGTKKERSKDTMDSLDYEAVRCASVEEISDAIKERGMNNMLAERIKEFLNRLVEEHGSVDLEWLRHVPPDKTKDYLLSMRGLGLKSVECVRLLTLHHVAFPVDTNVGRIAVRLGWVPLQPLPESLQLHLLELYPVLESIQKYLWPRLCKLDQRTLYELHYQMITFGKVFCTKNKPNCNACPMRAECRHFASAFASARLALPGPEDKHIVSMPVPIAAETNHSASMNPVILPLPENNLIKEVSPESRKCEPIIEEPATPEQEWTDTVESDIEDLFGEDPDEIPTIELNIKQLATNVENCMQEYRAYHEGDMSKALVTLNPQSASIPTPKLKNVSRLRTEHQVYELPDSHPLLEMMDKREPDDPSPYLLAIWTPGETANSIERPEKRCGFQDSTNLCNDETCFPCNSIREANSQTVRGTLLIPCRTATRGSFPLNGTYFQVNELFADHVSSIQPMDIPRAWIWNLPRRTVYFGTSVSSIFKGLSTQEIQHCFWRGFVCVRGFDQQTRAPRPLLARLHFPASKLARTKKMETRITGHVAEKLTSKS